MNSATNSVKGPPLVAKDGGIYWAWKRGLRASMGDVEALSGGCWPLNLVEPPDGEAGGGSRVRVVVSDITAHTGGWGRQCRLLQAHSGSLIQHLADHIWRSDCGQVPGIQRLDHRPPVTAIRSRTV